MHKDYLKTIKEKDKQPSLEIWAEDLKDNVVLLIYSPFTLQNSSTEESLELFR